MFGQIAPTAYDLRFRAFGVPVRVHPVFWLTSAYLAWPREDGDLRVLFIRVLCIFLAILVHELGHALVTRRFGWDSEIVLYFFGGYATSTRHSTWKDIAVSAAGPAAGLMLLASIWLPLYFVGAFVPGSTPFHSQFDGAPMMSWPESIRPGTVGNRLLLDAIRFSVFINLAWNLMNLIPVLPLDGGQISREICLWRDRGKGMETCLLISMISAGGFAAWCVKAYMSKHGVLGLEPQFLALMFGYLAFSNYQAYEQARRGYR